MRFREYSTLPDGLPVGKLNKISDVSGLKVGHFTLREDSPKVLRTGVSVLKIPKISERPLMAACDVFNGFGKSLGLIQVEELGNIESDVYFTNTLSIGAVQQGAVKLALREKPDLRTFNAVVMECNDGYLSDIASLAVEETMVFAASGDAREDFELGSVGAGTGMVCFGFKGGIGSASRIFILGGAQYNLGALVLANFGSACDLKLPGLEIFPAKRPTPEGGSLIMVVATDIPLLPHQLKRVARHTSLAIGILGASGYHGSGDITLAFTTGESSETTCGEIGQDTGSMDLIFKAAVWSTVEAILDSMFASPFTQGYRGAVDTILNNLKK